MRSVLDRFRKHLKTLEGPRHECWLWAWNRTVLGYGTMMDNYRVVYAHRLSWIANNGEIPAGLTVMHSCDNPPCVNPHHLSLGTQADNVRDAASKGRLDGGRGKPKYRVCKRHGILRHGCGGPLAVEKTD